MQGMKKRLASLVLAGSIMGGTALGAGAAPINVQAGNGAAGLINAIVDVIDDVNVDLTDVDVAVVELNNSLNNLRALNNVLNNSPILSNNEDVVDITVIDGDVVITDVLNDLNVDVDVLNVELDDIVAVIELASGDVILITR
jgi:Rieske Fe-S protein